MWEGLEAKHSICKQPYVSTEGPKKGRVENQWEVSEEEYDSGGISS